MPYENIPTTQRSAEQLAWVHGYNSVSELAQSLPERAQVIDVGSGASPFGVRVAAERPDVTWINFDYSYADPLILDSVSKGAPENVRFVAGDATELDKAFPPETFDAAFSYWLLPHLSIDDSIPAKKMAKALYEVTKTTGVLSVGPRAARLGLPQFRNGKAVRVSRESTLSADQYAENIVSDTKLVGVMLAAQRAINEVVAPHFGTSRYTVGHGAHAQVYSPEAGQYLPFYSVHTARTAGRLALDVVRFVRAQRRAERSRR